MQQFRLALTRLQGLLPPLLAGFVHRGVLQGDFRSDDFIHLFRIENFGFLDFVLQPYGGHLLLVRNAVFFFEHMLFGLEAFPYFVIALATHMLNTFLLFRVLERHLCGSHLAVLLASIWGMSPLCQEALSWVSVYGQVLASTLLLVLLDGVLRWRGRSAAPTPRVVAGWMVLLLALGLTFGTGLAVAVPAVLWIPLLLPAAAVDRRLVYRLAVVSAVLPLVYVGLHAVTPLGSETADPLSLQRSALDPANWWATASFGVHVMSFGVASLLLGPLIVADFTGVVSGPFQGSSIIEVLRWSRWLLALLALGLVVGLLRARGEERRRLVAFFILIAACYGVIALGRGVLYDALGRPLWVGAIVPRYQYLASIPVALLVGSFLAVLRPPARSSFAGALAYLWLAATVGLYATASRDLQFPNREDGRAEFDRVQQVIGETVAQSPAGADVYLANPEFAALGRWLARGDFFPGWAGVFVIAFPENRVDGRRVFFIEEDASVRALAARWPETRIAALLVAPPP